VEVTHVTTQQDNVIKVGEEHHRNALKTYERSRAAMQSALGVQHIEVRSTREGVVVAGSSRRVCCGFALRAQVLRLQTELDAARKQRERRCVRGLCGCECAARCASRVTQL
jgi:hypothetical protein